MPAFFTLCGAGIAANSVNKVCESVGEDLKTRVGYLIRYQNKVKKLREHVDKNLFPLKFDVQRHVETANRKGEVVDKVVSTWIENVNIMEECLATMEDAVKLNKKCVGCCPNYLSRYKTGRDAVKKLKESEKLQADGMFKTVSQQPSPAGIEDMPVGDFMNFSSTNVAMQKVMHALKDDSKHLIGIYGMGGVGKTTLMNEIGRRLRNDREFGVVVKVIVSHNPKVSQVRRDIADELGLKIWGDGEQAARRLAKRLKELDKVVIMMDDIWGRLDLKDVGIPSGKEHNGCKIILTSRTVEVCNLMETNESVLVDVLSESDSWGLFRSKAGDVVKSPEVEPIAKEVAKECGGLPLAIVVVGRALRGYDKGVWDDALSQLKQSSAMNIEGVEEQLYKSLELSYRRLSTTELRLVFLHCCLFREDHDISEDELARLLIGEGLLIGISTMNEMRSRVHFLLEKLKASCLLIGSEKEGCVRMHDVVRDVAVYIAYRDEDHFLVKAGLGLRKWPENVDLERCKRISLMSNDLRGLPTEPRCSNLLTLLLNVNPSLDCLPETFFKHMVTITVLDISDTIIKSLPLSFSCLENLGMLRLDRCTNLHDITMVGQLRRLRILSLQSCQAEQLPEQVGFLHNLKLLDVSNSINLKIPPNVICKLSQLEELYMLGCKVEEFLLVEIGSLKNLENLQVYVKDVQCFSRDICPFDAWENLRKFVIYTKYDWFALRGPFMTCLYLNEICSLANWARSLLRRSEDVILDDCKWGIEDWIEIDGLLNARKLRIARCHSIEYLFVTNSAGIHSAESFCCLEVLDLCNLEKLSGICCHNTQLPVQSFGKLKKLNITNCKNFGSNIFSGELIQRVNVSLQDLFVNGCHKTRFIFAFEKLGGCAVLTNLRSLVISDLPNLLGIWNGVIPFSSLKSIETIEVRSCPRLESIFFSHQLVLNKLRKLCIVNCGFLKHVFLPSLVKELQSIESLELRNNGQMIEIIGFEEGIEVDKSAFPRLKKLSLLNLPMLEFFSQMEQSVRTCFDWPSLKCLEVEDCSMLRMLPFGHESAPNMEKVIIDDDGELFERLEERIKSRFQALMVR